MNFKSERISALEFNNSIVIQDIEVLGGTTPIDGEYVPVLVFRIVDEDDEKLPPIIMVGTEEQFEKFAEVVNNVSLGAVIAARATSN